MVWNIRGNLPRIGKRCFKRWGGLAVYHRDFMPKAGQIPGRCHPDNASAENDDLHGFILTHKANGSGRHHTLLRSTAPEPGRKLAWRTL